MCCFTTGTSYMWKKFQATLTKEDLDTSLLGGLFKISTNALWFFFCLGPRVLRKMSIAQTLDGLKNRHHRVFINFFMESTRLGCLNTPGLNPLVLSLSKMAISLQSAANLILFSGDYKETSINHLLV